MRKKYGFTLIELLAVIVVLAIIALISTPIVLNIVDSAKKGAAEQSTNAYVKAIEHKVLSKMIEGNNVEDDEYLYNSIEVDITGTMPTSGIYSLKNGKLESGIFCINGYKVEYANEESVAKGKCAEGEDFRLNGSIELSETSGTYTYPESGTFEVTKNLSGGTLTCTTSDSKVANCSISENIVTVTPGPITSTAILTIKSEATTKYKEAVASYEVTTIGYKCIRATTLHTETCAGGSCTSSGYSSGATITYGSKGTSGTLKSGDAFDCDVNGDGTYDSKKERFYYVSDLYNTTSKSFDSNYAVLIYYNNTYKGVANNTTSSRTAYDSTNTKNNSGPITAIANLPTTTQWSNVSLYNTKRAILTEKDAIKTKAGTLPTAFSYEGYAARLLTTQELNKACGITVGSQKVGELDKCNYLMENTQYSSSSIGTGGYLPENPRDSYSSEVWVVNGSSRKVSSVKAFGSSYAVRPVIEIPKTDIAY